MLVEIPDPEIILGIVAAFIGGLLALYISYKIGSILRKRDRLDPSHLDRLALYETQLIDMKIRLDSLDIVNSGIKSAGFEEFKPVSERFSSRNEFLEERPPRHSIQPRRMSHVDYNNTVDYVLGLITDKPMTSRDIQIASRRSREHTSRLMKKLFQEGYVKRDTRTKPFSYSITDKGKGKLGTLEILQKQ